MVTIYNKDGWAVQVNKTDRGCVYEFQRRTILTGAAENIDLHIPFGIKLQRIEFFSDDATAKSFTERIYSGNIDPTSYDQLINLVNDTNQPIAYAGDEDNIYTQSPVIIRTAVSASTAAKILTKKVIVTRL